MGRVGCGRRRGLALFPAGRAFTIRASATLPPTAGAAVLCAEVVVFSFVGVLGITLALFFVVALTARLILGR